MLPGVDDKSVPLGRIYGITRLFFLRKLHMFIDHLSIVGFLLEGG